VAFIACPGDIATHFPVLQDMAGFTISENAALIKRHHAVRIAVDDFHVVFDEDDGCCIGRDSVDHAIHGGELLFRRNAGSWLVEQQQFRPAHQRHGDVDQFAHATGKFRDRTLGHVGKTKPREQVDRLVMAILRLCRRVE